MNNGIYRIRNIINDHCYIGSCAHKNGFPLRWNNHRQLLRKNKHHSIILQNAWNKYGENNLVFEIIEVCLPIDCIKREQFYLDTIHPTYNILPIAGSRLGVPSTEETKQKLRNRSYDWMRGDRNWNKSPEKREFYRKQIKITNPYQYCTEESFQRISKFHKGKSKSDIQKQRMSETAMGKPKSKEQVEKMQIFMKQWAQENIAGDKNYFHTHKYIGKDNFNFSGYYKFKNIQTQEEVVMSKTELSKQYSLDHTKVCAICNGKRKSHKQWVCIGKENS